MWVWIVACAKVRVAAVWAGVGMGGWLEVEVGGGETWGVVMGSGGALVVRSCIGGHWRLEWRCGRVCAAVEGSGGRCGIATLGGVCSSCAPVDTGIESEKFDDALTAFAFILTTPPLSVPAPASSTCPFVTATGALRDVALSPDASPADFADAEAGSVGTAMWTGNAATRASRRAVSSARVALSRAMWAAAEFVAMVVAGGWMTEAWTRR